MGKVSRRRMAMASAAILAASAPLVVIGRGAVASYDGGDSAAAPTLNQQVSGSGRGGSSDYNYNDEEDEGLPYSRSSSLTTAFSCGHTWRKAKTCSTLCPSGDDSACPLGQHCFGGISCSEGGESSMADILEKQGRMEQQEIDRLKRRRGEEYVERFVCGDSYEGAEASCSSDSGESASAPSSAAASYCPSGSSAQCPNGQSCYAAVSCPRSSHEEEVPLVEEVSLQLINSLMTEALLVDNSTFLNNGDVNFYYNTLGGGVAAVGEDYASLIAEEWRMFFRDSSTLLSESVGRLLGSPLSSYYGILN